MSSGLFGATFAGEPPSDLGVREGRLKPCPSRPNCVNSQATEEGHRIAPLEIRGRVEEALPKLRALIDAMPRTRVVTHAPDYLRVEFTSRVFGFVDDVEFSLDAAAGVVHVRSASRVGYSDLGVNRRRVETIREQFSGGVSND